MSRDPEGEAAAALAAGDRRAALAALMRHYGVNVHRYCVAMLQDAHLADDVRQTVFVEAWRDLPRFAGRSTFLTWLLSIARHRCLDALKAHRRRSGRLELRDAPPDLPDPGPDAERRLAADGAARLLDGCLDTLAPQARDVVLLHYAEGLSYAEIGRMSGERPGTLQMRVARAIDLLRRCLERRQPNGA